MKRLTRRRYRPVAFTDLIRSDRHHDRFFHHDTARLSDEEIWAERELLKQRLAVLIWHRDRSVIFGSDVLVGTPHPLTRQGWIRQRLKALQAEEARRRVSGERIAA